MRLSVFADQPILRQMGVVQHALHRRHRAPIQKPVRAVRTEEGSRGARAIMVVSGGNAVIQRHGVFPVNARGLPTATQGLTHFPKLNGNSTAAHR